MLFQYFHSLYKKEICTFILHLFSLIWLTIIIFKRVSSSHQVAKVLEKWLIWKDPDGGKDWGWEEKGTTEDWMVGWHHWLYGHVFEFTLGVGDRQGGLACCSPWGCKESDISEWLNWTEPIIIFFQFLQFSQLSSFLLFVRMRYL